MPWWDKVLAVWLGHSWFVPSESKRACVAHSVVLRERTVSARQSPDMQPFCSQAQGQGSLLFNLQWSVWGEALPCMADVYMGSCCQRCNRAYAQYKWSHIFWNQVVPKITHLTSAEWHGINGYAARRAQRDKYTSNTALLKNTLLWVRSLISTNIYFKTSTSSALICYKTFS